MDPAYADGWVNVARARIQEGNMAEAEPVLRAALQRDPQLAKTHFFLGTALKSLGRYDEAIEHLRQASASYPRDRVVLNQLGRGLFLQRRVFACGRPLREGPAARSPGPARDVPPTPAPPTPPRPHP